MSQSRRFFQLAVVVSFGGLFLGTGCTSSFDRYRAEGTRRLAQGRFASAKGLFQEAHQMVPENVDNLCDLALCYRGIARDYQVREDARAAVREIDRAINFYDRALQSYPGHRQALLGMNEALEMRGLYAEALQTAKWASAVVGPSAEQQLFLANEYAERGDADQALLAYRQAVAMEPNNPLPHRAIGLFYIRLERKQEGIDHLHRAFRLDPTQHTLADELRRLGVDVTGPSADARAG